MGEGWGWVGVGDIVGEVREGGRGTFIPSGKQAIPSELAT